MNSGIKLIVIDDDMSVIEMFSEYMGDKYTIDGYTSSNEGIEKIKKNYYDILILDYFIDSKNGKDVINQIRKFNNKIYILLLTGYSDQIKGLESLDELDVQNYCEKSGDFQKVITCIEGAIKSIEFVKNKKDTIGQRLRDLRQVYNLSQDDVAKYLGVKRSTVTGYETGNIVPSTDAVLRLAELFNVTTDYVLCYELNIRKINK